jgi:putative hemolysin
MKDRIDPLILERAPWLGHRAAASTIRPLLDRLLQYPQTLRLGETVRDLPAPEIMERVASLIAKQVTVEGLDNLPETGPVLVVANHPTGIADGLVVWRALAQRRPDLFFYANSDVLRILPQMETLIAPVEWRQDKRSHARNRVTMDYTRRALGQGRLGVIFPSGRLAKRRGLRLYERPWMSSAAMIARKFDVPVVPLHIRSRNSVLFYLFDLVHPTLRDVTLFHEVLNKAQQPFALTLGEPIPARRLPQRADEAIAFLRRCTLMLDGPEERTITLVRPPRHPSTAQALTRG